MLRRLFRTLVKLAVLGAVVAAVSKLLQRRQLEPLAPVATGPWPPLDVERPAPIPHEPVVDAGPVEDEPVVDAGPVEDEPVVAEGSLSWVEPDDGECRASHPIKAKLSSGVFHLPGMMHYDRTNADRCYPDAAAAEADGLRQAKR